MKQVYELHGEGAPLIRQVVVHVPASPVLPRRLPGLSARQVVRGNPL